MAAAQDGMCEAEPRLRAHLVRGAKLHFTVALLHLPTAAAVAAAAAVLTASGDDLRACFPAQAPLLLDGAGAFGGRVVYVKPTAAGAAAMAALSARLLSAFRDAGLATPGNHAVFAAHMTVAKLKFGAGARGQGLRTIAPAVHAPWAAAPFGAQLVGELLLCPISSATVRPRGLFGVG